VSDRPVVSIVLGSLNRRRFLASTIASVRRQKVDVPCEIVVIDGGSTDGSLAWLARQKDVTTIIQHNCGKWRGEPLPKRSWGYFMNLAFQAARGEHIVMISDDCLMVDNALASGLRRLDELRGQGRQVGALAFYWRDWPEEPQYKVGLTLGGKMFVNHGLYVRSALEAIGWIDETRYRFYFADADLCLKLWHAGYEVCDSPDSYVEHYLHASWFRRLANIQREAGDWEAFKNRWRSVFFQNDDDTGCGWWYKDHTDPTREVNRFPFGSFVKYCAAKGLRKCRDRLRRRPAAAAIQ